MILYLEVNTDIPDLFIDYIEVELNTGENVSLNWDESDIERFQGGFQARYKGVYFGENAANGKINLLLGMRIVCVGIYTESESGSQITIISMQFDDAGNLYSPECVPYIANLKDCDITKKEEQQQR